MTNIKLLLGSRRHDLYYPDGWLSFLIRYSKWRYRVQFGAIVESSRDEKLTIILLNYKRQHNIDPLVRSVLKCAFVDRVVVCNNNPDLAIENWVKIRDSRLHLLNQAQNMGPRYRFELASQETGEYFLFIDDDILLYPEQIERVFSYLLREPAVPHGVRGQVVFNNREFIDGVYGIDCKVDILNGVYAFTKVHLVEYFRLEKSLNGVPMADDIVLSFAGESVPLCHDVGDIMLCPTESVPEIAVWKQSGFLKSRLAALRLLSEVKRFPESAVSLPPLHNLRMISGESLFAIDTINGEIIETQTQPIIITQDHSTFIVRGWAVDSRTQDVAGGVYIDIDGQLYPAYYGSERKDVAESFAVEAYKRSGYQRAVVDLKPGVHRLSIIILTHDRAAYYKPEAAVTFEIRPREFPWKLSSPVASQKVPRDDRQIQVRLIRNLFPHWAAHSGAHQFTNFIDRDKCQFDQAEIPLGDSTVSWLPSQAQEYLRRVIKKNGNQWYDLNNLRAESGAVFDCLKNSPDIIHCLDGEYVQYLPKFLKKVGWIRRRPAVMANFHQPPELLQKILNKEIVRLLDHIVVYCKAQAIYFERFMPFAKISIVPHGIDTSFYQPGVRKSDGILRCITVGFWLRDFETIWTVIRMFRDYKDIEFHLVTSKQEPPQQFSNVKLYQGLNDEQLLKLYQKADVLFMPLLDSGANNAILESAACGLPIISNDIGGVPEYTDHSFARLVPEGDVDAFAEAILQLRSSPERRREMGLAARRFAEEHFTWPKVAEQMVDVYRRVLAARHN